MVTARSSGKALTWLVELDRCVRGERKGRRLNGKQLGLDSVEDVKEAKAPSSAPGLC